MNFNASNETISRLECVLDEIRLFVRQGFSADPILVRDVAAEFAETCAYTNQRLHKVSRLLSQGLTSEAIQLANQSPALIPLVGQLSFPEAEQWRSLLYHLNLEQPPEILSNIAQEFEAAQGNFRRLQTLLDQHRLLALARAPLSSRILVLRKIRRREPNNPAWKADLMAWEAQRLAQISAELKTAAQKHDLEKLADLRFELKSSWLQVVPEELVQQSRRELANEKARRSKSTMAAAVTQFAAARAEGDVQSAMEAQDQLRELGDQVRNATISSPQPALEDLQWLEKQQQAVTAAREFAAEVKVIGNMITFEAQPTVIQHRLRSLELLNQVLPAKLIERANRYFSRRKRQQRISVGLRIAAIGLGITVIVAGLFGIIRSATYQRDVTAFIEKIENLSGSEKYDEAKKLIDESPQFEHVQKIVELWLDLDKKLESIKTFDDEYDKLKKSIEVSAGIANSQSVLDDLENLAVTANQKNLARKLNLRWQELTNKENPVVQRCTSEVKKLMLRLPASVTKLEENKQILVDLVSKSGANFSVPELNSVQRTQANDILAYVENGLMAAKADSITGIQEFPQALGELEKLPKSIHSQTDLKFSRTESQLWIAFRESQIIAAELTPEAFAEMTVEHLTVQVEKLVSLDSLNLESNLIGEKQTIVDLKIKVKAILEDCKNKYPGNREKALDIVNEILRPTRTQNDGNANSKLAVRLEVILKNNELATIEATYIKVIECLIDETEGPEGGASSDVRGRIVRDLERPFAGFSLPIRDALKAIKISANNEPSNAFFELKKSWKDVRTDILAKLSEILNLTKWRKPFEYQCIGWLYEVPKDVDVRSDMLFPYQFTIVGEQKEKEGLEIYCLVPTVELCNMVRCGKLKGGIISQDPNDARLQAGRPVFVKK